MHGLLNLPWWGYIVITVVLTQITIASVTIYLHRCQAHRAVELHPIVSHFFRFWLWLTTGQNTKAWAAIHRKHHAKVETEEDPHSPQVKGIWPRFRRYDDCYAALHPLQKSRKGRYCEKHRPPQNFDNLYSDQSR